MKRRKFIIGTGALAAGSSAAMGSGAFLAESSGRTATITTAHDARAQTALERPDHWHHSQEYTRYDKKGHLVIRIPRLNSGSKWYFDKLFRLHANLTPSDGKHKYWIDNKYPGWFKPHKKYDKPSDGKVPRVRWFCQRKDGDGKRLFRIPTPSGWKWVHGHWISGDGDSFVKLKPSQRCAVGVCIITRGLPKEVLKKTRDHSILKKVKINAKKAHDDMADS